MSEEKFNLKWHEFQQNVSNTFSKLRNQSSLFDVTLVSNDHKAIQAHKLVLSACSEFFREIFHNNVHPNPLLYLDNIHEEDLNLVLDYIYQGEVQIFQESLDRFLDIATKLKLEGLQSTERNEDDGFKHESVIDDVAESEVYDADFIDFESRCQLEGKKQKQRRGKISQSIKPYELAVNCETKESQNMEIEAKFQEVVVKDGHTFMCTICQKQIVNKKDMRRHVETHMTGLKYDCQQCGKSFRYSTSLIRHKKKCHNI